MIGQEIFDTIGIFRAKLLIESVAVNVFRERSGVVVNECIRFVVDKLRDILIVIINKPIRKVFNRYAVVFPHSQGI